jgi:gamma-glutamyltranspeptidase / glutathione hydrolase
MKALVDWRRMAGALAVLTAAAFPALAQLAPAPEPSTGRAANRAGTATRDMVAAANPLAAQAGRQILAAGGSAADAAIAVQLVLNLVEPQSSGLGGGAFM